MNTQARHLRPVRFVLLLALAAGALLALVASAGAATDNGRLYWVNSSSSTIGTALISTPSAVSALSPGGIPNSVFASSSALYWTSANPAQIGIGTLTGQLQSFITPGGTSNPTGVVAVGPYIYWSDNGFIGRALTSGAAAQTGYAWLATPNGQNTTIWSDGAAIYWGSANAIGRVGLDGGAFNPAYVMNTPQIPTAVVSPTALAADAQRIYWINQNASQISSAAVATGAQITPTYLALPAPAVGLAQTGTAFFWSALAGTSIGTANLTPAVVNAGFIQTALNPTDIAVSRYALTVAKPGAGVGTVAAATSAAAPSLICGPVCAADYPDMAVVTLTATHATGSVFAGWSGGGCTGTALICTVTMNAAQSVNATFTPAITNFVLTLTRKGTAPGSVVSTPIGLNCGTVCAAPFAKNTKVTLTAVEGPLSDFAGWAGACSGFKQQSTCTVTMSEARAASYTFNPAPILTLSKFSLSRTTFRVGSHSTSVRAYTPVGTTIKYTLSEAANVTVAFQKVGYARQQVLYRSSGLKGGMVGANAISFTGRVGRTALTTGRWKVIITSSDGRTTTRPQVKYFTIKK